MRKLVLVVVTAAVLLATAAPAAAQVIAQPSQGEQSAGRNIQGTGFGPHCHVVVAASESAPFPFISVMPSHTAHLATNAAIGGSAVFQADPNCDGDPGQ
jgi:hypothetical protein